MFTFDPATTNLLSANITVTGPAYAGAYDTPHSAVKIGNSATEIFVQGTPTTNWVVLEISPALGTSGQIVDLCAGQSGDYCASSFSGQVVSNTPLPAALPLFAAGLGALALLGWCRKRTARSVAV
jgi:hypothetical protein